MDLRINIKFKINEPPKKSSFILIIKNQIIARSHSSANVVHGIEVVLHISGGCLSGAKSSYAGQPSADALLGSFLSSTKRNSPAGAKSPTLLSNHQQKSITTK